VSVAEVARRHGLNANLLFSWRRLHREGLLAKHTRNSTELLPIQVNGASREPAFVPPSAGVIEIELANGVRLRVKGEVS
jgi:transposase